MRTLLGLLVMALTMTAALLYRAGLGIDPTAPATLGYGALLAVLAFARWACHRPAAAKWRWLGDMAGYCGLFIGISLAGAVASYPVAALSSGFSDAILQRSDRVLHFDWLAWYRLVASHPYLQLASRSAYGMIYVSPAILLGWLALTGQRREAHDFLAAVWLAAWITLLGFRFMPAIGPFGFLWHAPIAYVPVSDLWQPELIPQLRSHAIREVDLGHLVGLVSAPSFHAAAGVLMIVFAARQRRIAAPMIALNLGMLLATPVEGTHYLTDMILGAGVAGLALLGLTGLRQQFEVPDTLGPLASDTGALA